jgi:hypothetical protein
MNRTSLFAIKTNFGYGLFQCYEKTAIKIMQPYYLIYDKQIPSLSDEEILVALKDSYYYQRIQDQLFRYVKDKDILSNDKRVVCSLQDLEPKLFACYENCHVAYIGEYGLPRDAVLPQFSRKLDINYFTGKYSWIIVDESNFYNDAHKSKPMSYKALNIAIAYFPDYYGIYPTELLRRLNCRFRLNDFNDEYALSRLEEYYTNNPHMRPVKEKYDDIKYSLPTDSWRKMLDDPENENEYLFFCDKTEQALKEFIASIDENRKVVKKPLVVLIKTLNKIETETGQIGTLEAEGLYDYIAKVLQSLKKPQLIETVESLSEW